MVVGIIFLTISVMLAIHRKIIKYYHIIPVAAAQFDIADKTCGKRVPIIEARENGEFSFVCPGTEIQHTVTLVDKRNK